MSLQVLGVIPDFSLAYEIHRGNQQLARLAGCEVDPVTPVAVSAVKRTSQKKESVLHRIRGRLTGNQFQDLEPPGLPDRLNWVTRLCPTSMVAEQFRVVAIRLTLLGLERIERTSQHIVGKSLAMLQPTCQVGVIVNGLAENRLSSFYYPYDKVKQSMKMIGV